MFGIGKTAKCCVDVPVCIPVPAKDKDRFVDLWDRIRIYQVQEYLKDQDGNKSARGKVLKRELQYRSNPGASWTKVRVDVEWVDVPADTALNASSI